MAPWPSFGGGNACEEPVELASRCPLARLPSVFVVCVVFANTVNSGYATLDR